MKIAITGASGFVGSHLAKALLRKGHQVVPVSRRLGRNITRASDLTGAFQGCDAVAHCAGINREIRDQTYQSVHIQGTQNVISAAKRVGIKKIVFMSFLRARPNCGSPYHESKWESEEMLRHSSLNYTILKPGVIYGRGDHMLDHLSQAFYTFPIFGLVGFREKRVRPLSVDDVSRVLAASLVDPRLKNKTVAVTGPEELTLAQAVRRVASVAGKKPIFFRLPVLAHHLLAWLFERTMRIPLVSLACRNRDHAVLYIDIQRIGGRAVGGDEGFVEAFFIWPVLKRRALFVIDKQ